MIGLGCRQVQVQRLEIHWVNRRCPQCNSGLVSLSKVYEKYQRATAICQDCKHEWFIRGPFKYRIDDAQKVWISHVWKKRRQRK